MNPYSFRKGARAPTSPSRTAFPSINLVESGGADLPAQAELFIPGGRAFRDLTRRSAAALPTVALVFGNSTAGGAYVPGMSDYIVMIEQRSKVFLGGPPLVKMATGEESTDEELGGASMHARVSGLADELAADELDAIRIGRQIVSRLHWRKRGPGPSMPADEPVHDPDELLGIASADPKVPFDPREVLARVVDGSRFDEFKPLYGTSLVTGWASIHGYPIGVLANHRGVLFSEEAHKATQFIQLANQIDVPLLFLQNTTGYMVGKEYEQRGIIKHGAMMINAVSNSSVPHLTVNIGASYGAGNYGMCGRAYEPRFLFAWPNAALGGDGPGPAGRRALHRRPPVGGGAGASPSTRRPTRPCGRWSRPRSRPSRSPCSSPHGSTTTASSTRATPGRCSASACRSSTTSRSPAPAATACSGREARAVTTRRGRRAGSSIASSSPTAVRSPVG